MGFRNQFPTVLGSTVKPFALYCFYLWGIDFFKCFHAKARAALHCKFTNLLSKEIVDKHLANCSSNSFF